MKVALIVIAVVVLALLIFGGSLVSTRNELVVEKESIAKQWARKPNPGEHVGSAHIIVDVEETPGGMARIYQSVDMHCTAWHG